MFWNSKNDTKASNPESIKDFLDRGVENIYPSREFVESKLKEGNKLTMYLGIDPTGPTLHLGHAIVLKKLHEFQELGHKVILLIGDFTAMIGDPTDKTAMRKKLSRKEVLDNAKLYKKQVSTFLNFSGDNYAEIKYNSEWLSEMSFEEVLDLASNMTVEQMLKRDMFEERKKQDKPIYIHEFLYPLMQGYDSVAMKIDGEIGGNDQTFNMLAGRTLMKQMLGKEKFVITTKLLEDTTGAKMGKTEGNMIKLTDSANEMFGKVMSWTDEMIIPGFELTTNISRSDLEKIKAELESDANPKDIKMRLAGEIVSIYHGESSAEKAKENFTNTFSGGGVPEDIKKKKVKNGVSLYDAVEEFVKSKSDLRRLVEAGAVTEMGGEKITDINFRIEKNMKIKIGPRRFIEIEVS